jgi:hypothetical protein
MNYNKQLKLTRECLNNIFNNDFHYKNVEGNVPEDMRIGSVDEDGWVEWKLIDSHLNNDDMIEYENMVNSSLPSLFKVFLKTYYFCDSFTLQNPEFIRFKKSFESRDEFYEHYSDYNGFFAEITFLELPSENTLKKYKNLVLSWHPLLKAGYIPFAEWQDGQGPVCFDTKNRYKDDDFKIVWFDHEELFDLGEERCEIRDEVQPLANELFESFEELLEEMFLKRVG